MKENKKYREWVLSGRDRLGENAGYKGETTSRPANRQRVQRVLGVGENNGKERRGRKVGRYEDRQIARQSDRQQYMLGGITDQA